MRSFRKHTLPLNSLLIRWHLVSLLLLTFFKISAQDYRKKEIDLDAFIQQLFPTPSEDLPYEELYETLFQYYQNPLDLNSSTRDELASLFILSELQINNFISYRENQGQLLSIYELQIIEGFDLQTIYKLLPFVEVSLQENYKSLIQKISKEENRYLILKTEKILELKKGYRDFKNDSVSGSRYLGDANKIYGRFRISHSKDFSLGVTVEKDAGEAIGWLASKAKYGADFISCHAFLQNKKHFKSIALGDYQIQFGQGLILGAGFAPGKGAETITTIRKSNLGIRPYTSSLERGFFRGGAFTYSMGRVEITSFYSNLNEDGAIKEDSLNEEFTQSFSSSGLHRTFSELASRKIIRHQSYGSNVDFSSKSKNIQLGITYVASLFEVPMIRKPLKYNQYEFSGDHNSNLGFHYSFVIQNFNFFGEAALSKSGGTGILSGFVSSLSSKVELSMLYRSYQRDFHAFYGGAFGENTKNINEEGMYIGLKFIPIKSIVLTVYFDRFYKPWLSYLAYAPSHGYEYLARILYQPSKSLGFYAQYKQKTKERNSRTMGEEPLAVLEEESAANILLNMDYKASALFQFKSRLQSSSISQGKYKSKGFALSQDIILDLGKCKISARFALFDTDDYTSRQYVYEKDVLYSFSIPALYGQGIRNYLMIEYSINKRMDIWLRASRVTKNNVQSIGSGLEEINGNKRTDVKIQLRYRL